MEKRVQINRLEGQLELIKKMLDSRSQRSLLQASLEGAVDLCRGTRGFILLLHDGRQRIKATHNWPRAALKGPIFKAYGRVTEQVLRKGEAFLSADAAVDSRINLYPEEGQGQRALLAAPILSEGRPSGVLCITRLHGGDNPPQPHDLGLLRDLGEILGTILQRISEIGALRAEQVNLKRTAEELEEMAASLQEDVAAKSVELAHFERTLLSTTSALRSRYSFQNIVTQSPKMHRVFELITRVTDYPVPVLITGESGTGKELIARALHYASARRDLPFMAINCAAMPETLLESELFGYKRGAFTGANADKEGLLRVAGEGTLFLDEIGELPLGLQAKLLRVIQEKEVLPIGGHKVEPFSARLVSATHRDLRSQIDQGRFREDLFFRLKVVEIPLPPLRERPEDIPPLVDHFLERFQEELSLPKRPLSPAALRALMRHPWGGNVRELENALKSALILSASATLEPEDFALESAPSVAPPPSPPPTIPLSQTFSPLPPSNSHPHEIQTREDWEAQEKEEILAALVQNRWNKTRAAKQLGISRRNLYRKLSRYGIERARSPESTRA